MPGRASNPFPLLRNLLRESAQPDTPRTDPEESRAKRTCPTNSFRKTNPMKTNAPLYIGPSHDCRTEEDLEARRCADWFWGNGPPSAILISNTPNREFFFLLLPNSGSASIDCSPNQSEVCVLRTSESELTPPAARAMTILMRREQICRRLTSECIVQ